MNETATGQNRELRHQAGAAAPAEACAVLRGNPQLLPHTGAALDLACGCGGNALFLAHRGLRVTACDISKGVLRKLREEATRRELRIETQVCDAAEAVREEQAWHVITISHFLDRSITDQLIKALTPNGLLYYQTFTTDRQGDHPRNPDYLLRPNELLRLFASLELLYYREERNAGDGVRRLPGKACLVGRRREGA